MGGGAIAGGGTARLFLRHAWSKMLEVWPFLGFCQRPSLKETSVCIYTDLKMTRRALSCRGPFRRPVASLFDAHFFDLKYLLPQFVLTCSLLLSVALATPSLNDAENAIAALSHPHGAQYSFRLLDVSAAAKTVDEFRHIPVSSP